jgi:hypothetical protein
MVAIDMPLLISIIRIRQPLLCSVPVDDQKKIIIYSWFERFWYKKKLSDRERYKETKEIS